MKGSKASGGARLDRNHRKTSNSNIRLDGGMRRVALDLEILDRVVVDTRCPSLELHRRERTRLTLHLLAGLIEMIEIKVGIASDPNELTKTQVGLLRQHELER